MDPFFQGLFGLGQGTLAKFLFQALQSLISRGSFFLIFF